MSSEYDKEKHSKRIHQKSNYIHKQLKIAKSHGMHVDEPHTLAKHSATTCGDSNCVMCGNPRKFIGEETIQEQRFKQDMEHVRGKHSNGIYNTTDGTSP